MQLSDNALDIKTLENKLREASKAYYNSDSILMSDDEFDGLKSQLEELDPLNPFLKEIGAAVDQTPLSKAKHHIPMGSLKKVKTFDELGPFLELLPEPTSQLSLQYKMDGCSVELVYKKGLLVQAITRGDGIEGEDITHNMGDVYTVPKIITDKRDIYIRGELIILISVWNANLKTTTNPRNACSGIMRRLDSKGAANLSFFAFDIDIIGYTFNRESDKIQWFLNNSIARVSAVTTDLIGLQQAIENFKIQKSNLDYETDGLVLKINDTKTQKELGDHEGYPYWAKALKWPPQSATTILERIEWNVGSRGVITPVGIIKPTKLNGVTISRVSLHNMDEIERLNLRIGDAVELIRANDVIPKITRVVKSSKGSVISCPSCPVCAAKTIKEGPFLYCVNKDKCGGVEFRRIMKWVTKRNIMFVGEATITSLVGKIILSGIADLYHITPQMLKMAGFGDREAERFIQEVEKSRVCTLVDFMGSLSLDMLGRREAQNIHDELNLKSIDDWKNISVSDLIACDGFQKTLATRIVTSIKDNAKLIDAVAKEMRFVKPIKLTPPASGGTTGPKLAGKSVCFTGTMSMTRGVMEALAIQHGAEISSVKKGLSYLVSAEPDSTSTKAQKALALAVPIITEEEFRKMIV